MTEARPLPKRLTGTEKIFRTLLFMMISVGSISFSEPSPYEIIFLVFVPVMVLLDQVTMTRVTVALVFIVLGFQISEVVALLPYLADRPTDTAEGVGSTATVYTLQTMYLFISLCLFAIVFTRQTQGRISLFLKAYTLSCLIAAVWGILAFLAVPGVRDSGLIEGRIAGPFKDPNVLGSYCVLGVLYLMRSALFGSAKLRLFNLAMLGVVMFGGIFLPLSRGAWGATAVATVYLLAVSFKTADSIGMRRKIVASIIVLMFGLGVAGVFVASNSTLRSSVLDRAKVEQDYDSGVTGRFGNQQRSIPMLMERPLGFGPHRFSFYFELDPHNSYIGAFASAGWIGGTFFLLFVLVTCGLALRLSLRPNPFLRHAQVVAPALLSAFIQALQIDIDHWRFIYLMAGSIWGMEAARQLGLRRSAAQPKAPVPSLGSALAASAPGA